MTHGVPTVSIVLSNYNGGAWLPATLDGVSRQSFDDWELIAVDDCSTDGSADLLDSWARADSRIRVLRLDANSGRPAVPRNRGVCLARGRWIALLDADDVWHPRKLELQLQAMERTGARFSSTRMVRFSRDGELDEFRAWLPTGERVKSIDHDTLLLRNCIPASSVIVERDLLGRDPFYEDPRYKGVEDYHCWLRIHHRRIDRSIQLHDCLTFYRVLTQSVSASKSNMIRRKWVMYSEYVLDGARLSRQRRVFYALTSQVLAIVDRIQQEWSRRTAR